jgi:hypothetical protein
LLAEDQFVHDSVRAKTELHAVVLKLAEDEGSALMQRHFVVGLLAIVSVAGIQRLDADVEVRQPLPVDARDLIFAPIWVSTFLVLASSSAVGTVSVTRAATCRGASGTGGSLRHRVTFVRYADDNEAAKGARGIRPLISRLPLR